MKLYKRRGSNVYYVALTLPSPSVFKRTGGKIRRSTGQETKKKALEWAEELREKLQQEAIEKRLYGKCRITLNDALQQYLDHLQAHEKSSWRQQDGLRRKLLGLMPDHWSLSGDQYLHDLTPADIERLIRARRNEGAANQTIAHEIKLIRAAANYAVLCGRRGAERFVSLRSWRLPATSHKTRWLTWKEWQAVYAELDPNKGFTVVHRGHVSHQTAFSAQIRADRQRAQDLFVVLTLAGGRWGEVAKLIWDRVDIERGSLRLWASKTATERLAPLPEEARKVLQRRYAERRADEPLVFPGRLRQPLRSCRPIIAAFRRAGLNTPEKVASLGRATLHSLRHTYAAWCAQQGANLFELQETLGHKSLRTTHRYVHLTRLDGVERLARLLNGVTAGGTRI